MPRSRQTIPRTLAPLAAAALAAAGCGDIAPTETTGTYELFTGTGGSAWCDRGDEARLQEDGADLVGPHFAVSFLCHYAGTEAPEQVAAAVEELADLPQVIDGAELLVNQIALAPTYEPVAEDGEVTAWIEAGEERFDLDALPLAGGYVAVTVPTGTDAVLWVEDEGRSQGLDFRTGAQVEPVTAYYNGLSRDAVDLDGYAYEEVQILNNRKSYELTCSSGWGQATRSVWSEERGWPSDGTVYLEIEFNWCDAYEGVVDWRLDQEAALSLQGGDDPVAPISWEESSIENDRILVTAVFEAPADAEELTVEFTPVGNLETLNGGEDYAFADGPESTEWTMSF
ncbi:hypothetical protein [Glycomyces xiaoerkulensis]|uniref:hypothetical protein n=1 Tax=Glycomyces xiaoerkulensis TaxID=2038139 RepID=UPI000C26A5FE|nr:hypothetical protein [Glycomyces xiaoerkulensis]